MKESLRWYTQKAQLPAPLKNTMFCLLNRMRFFTFKFFFKLGDSTINRISVV